MSAKMEQWKGRIKSTAGTFTEKRLERSGRSERQTSDTEARLTQAKRKVNEMIDKAAVAASRRGSGRRRRAERG